MTSMNVDLLAASSSSEYSPRSSLRAPTTNRSRSCFRALRLVSSHARARGLAGATPARRTSPFVRPPPPGSQRTPPRGAAVSARSSPSRPRARLPTRGAHSDGVERRATSTARARARRPADGPGVGARARGGPARRRPECGARDLADALAAPPGEIWLVFAAGRRGDSASRAAAAREADVGRARAHNGGEGGARSR